MASENIPYKIYLSEDEMPRTWYNVRADMKVKPAPLRNPATGAPMSFDDLRPVFCDELIRQELDNDDREIPIPDEIRDFYKMYRPSPLVRAYCLEKQLQTPAKLYYNIYFDGSEEPETLSPDDYQNLTEEMTNVPYDFSDNYDFLCDGTTHTFYFYVAEYNNIGVSPPYTGGGETHRSNIVWATNPTSIKGVSSDSKSVKSVNYYDLSGRQVSAPAQGRVAAGTINLLAKRPNDWLTGIMLCVVVEFYAILSLLASFIMLTRI